MVQYVLLRLLNIVPTLLLVAVIVFLLIRVTPGDPVVLMLGDAATPEAIARLHKAWGLDQPIAVQFWIWLKNAVVGDLGRSITNGEAVGPLLLRRGLVSLPIVLFAVLLAALIATPLGLLAAAKQNKATDVLIVATTTLFLSIPSFWLGLMLLLYFGIELGWVPIIGYVSIIENPIEAAGFIVLPIVTLTLVEFGLLTRMMRATSIDVMRMDYVTHARAKGLDERAVFRRHVLPNAFGPTWTMIGLVLGSLLGGVAVVETVFTIPGLGRLLVDAIFSRDYPVIQGCLLFTAAAYVIVNLVFDLMLPIFDPRVRQ